MRGYFGVAVYKPKREVNVGSLWRSATAFGAAFLATVGARYDRQASDTCASRLHVPLHHYASMADLLRHLPHGCPVVGVELDPRATPLDGYTHRDRALYLLGAEDNGLPPSVVDACHDLVVVPTVAPWSINVACAGTVVLAHRHMQRARAEVA